MYMKRILSCQVSQFFTAFVIIEIYFTTFSSTRVTLLERGLRAETRRKGGTL